MPAYGAPRHRALDDATLAAYLAELHDAGRSHPHRSNQGSLATIFVPTWAWGRGRRTVRRDTFIGLDKLIQSNSNFRLLPGNFLFSHAAPGLAILKKPENCPCCVGGMAYRTYGITGITSRFDPPTGSLTGCFRACMSIFIVAVKGFCFPSHGKHEKTCTACCQQSSHCILSSAGLDRLKILDISRLSDLWR